jgi:hypothetical protein
MLIIGQPDKMLTDLRNSKASTELSAMSMRIVVSADNHNVLNLVFSLHTSQCLPKLLVQQGHCFIAPTAHSCSAVCSGCIYG